MGIQVLWEYRYRDARLEATIADDPREPQIVWGLLEGELVGGGANVAGSGMSKFILWEYERIRDQMIAVFLYRCWRFPDCYAVLGTGLDAHNTLVVRRRMLDVSPPGDFGRAADAILADHIGDKVAAISRLRRRYLERMPQRLDFDFELAWEIYYHRALEKAGASIIVVEGTLQESFWSTVRHNVRYAKKVKVRRIDGHTFVAVDGQYSYQQVDVARMTCTCSEFRKYGRLIGLHCSHLVAALREAGMWDRYWGNYIPAPDPARRAGETTSLFENI